MPAAGYAYAFWGREGRCLRLATPTRDVGKITQIEVIINSSNFGKRFMSTQQWDDARLDRLANSLESLTKRVDNIAIATENNNRLIESNARVIQALTNRVDSIAIATENNNRLIESNARVIQALANVAAEAREERQQILQVIAQQQESMDQKQTIIVQQQEDIRGLQTENRRILDILLNQRNQEDNPTA